MDKDFLSQIDRLDELIASAELLSDETLICECFCVNVADIRETCRSLGTVDLNMVQDKFNLGHGCQGCLKEFDTWVNKIF
jgi:NAD(P)H-nitrite reductase large subunit